MRLRGYARRVSKRGDAVVGELQRRERRRRALIAVALLTAFAAAVSVFVFHTLVVRVAITLAAFLVLYGVKRGTESVLDPFTMDKATRPSIPNVLSAKAQHVDDELRNLVETELAASTQERGNERDD